MDEIKIPLQHKQKQFLEAIEKYPICFFGGAKGGGKSYGLRNILLWRRFAYNGSHGAIFRRTYSELESNHIRPLFEQFPTIKTYWHDSKKLLTLPNGSTLQFCHCNNEADVDLYQGREFHDLGIDEAGQWTESMFRKLLGSNRSSKLGIKARTILTGNPGGIGHAWLKRLFIERRFTSIERSEDYTFIQALVDDNPALIKNDPDYVHRLNSEPNEALRKSYRYGDWDIYAGQFFGEIRREVHFISPFPIPPHWAKFGAYDFGFNHPSAFGWFACNEDGDVYLYRELIKPGLRIDQLAKELNNFPDTKDLIIDAGHDCWARKGVLSSGSPTIAEEFVKHNIYLQRAKIDRIQGAAQLRNYLAWQNKSNGINRPRFFIFNTCPISFDALTRMQHDPDRPEDVLKIDATEGDPYSGDDAYDMIRYGLMSRPLLADRPAITDPAHQSVWEPKHIKKLQDQVEREEQIKAGHDVAELPEEMDEWDKAWGEDGF